MNKYKDYKSMMGSIEVICGSMFSGKTEELLRRIKRVKIANLKIKLFKPAIDTRYHSQNIVSHDSNEIEAIAINEACAILDNIDGIQVIAIDEAQFFDEKLIAVCEELANKGLRVIVAGLDMDFSAKPFGIMPQLLSIADDVLKLHAVCVRCGEIAQFTYRKSLKSEQVLLGEKNDYEALCRNCYYA